MRGAQPSSSLINPSIDDSRGMVSLPLTLYPRTNSAIRIIVGGKGAQKLNDAQLILINSNI
ncbi:MAG: hypothetical protein PUP92_34550, partial [Rhizonema sp. PD38]|nr:hypothetical protein [Rhizonema sp. PD38]